MRSSHRDRCRSACAALCLAALLITLPAGALTAEYRILPNGSAYLGTIEIEDADRFEFAQTGILGERIPSRVSGIVLSGNCSPCNYTMNGGSAIQFRKGNYTVHFQAPVHENHISVSFDRPYRIEIILPQGLDIRNPLLGMISPGAAVTEADDGSLIVNWNSTRSAELRFYTKDRESLLYFFGNFWIIIAVVLLLPFILTWRRKG